MAVTAGRIRSQSWPGPSNTGVPAGTSLTTHSGDLTSSSNGQVIDAMDVVGGSILINHNNVTIRRTRVTAASDSTGGCVFTNSHSQTGTIIEDCELDGASTVSICGIFSGYSMTVRRLNVHHCENGLDVDGFFDVRDSWVHDLSQTGADPHTDACQIAANATNVNIVHNVLDCLNPTYGTSAFITNTSIGHSDVYLCGNKLWGGASTIYFPSNPSPRFYVNYNRFIEGAFFYTTNDVANITEFVGNVDDITGAAITA